MNEKEREKINYLISACEKTEVNLFNRSAQAEDKENLINKMTAFAWDRAEYKLINGFVYSTKEKSILQKKLNLDDVSFYTEPKYAIIVRNGGLRVYPEKNGCFLKNYEIDYFAVKWLKIGERVIVWHYTADKKWCYIQTDNAWGWFKEENLAYTNEQEWLEYDNRPFVVVCEPKIIIDNPKGFRQELYFASRLVLDRIYADHYALILPLRGKKKTACFKKVLVRKDVGVCEGYAELSGENVVRLGKMFLDEKYDWGGKYGRHDCTSLIGDLYRACGIILPTNSHKQLFLPRIKKIALDTSEERRRELINEASVGSILLFQGHGMIYLGESGGKEEILHSVYRLQEGKVNKTVIGDLSQIRENGQSLLNSLEGVWDIWHLPEEMCTDE